VRLSFAEVELALRGVHRIRPEKAVAFRARLKHLQREGWPLGTNTGTGTRANYTLNSLMQMAMALELLQSGITPKRAVAALKSDWSDLVVTLALSQLSAYAATNWADFPMRESEELFWIVRPEALQDLTTASAEPRPGNLEIMVQRSSQVMPDLLSFEAGNYREFGALWRSLVIRLSLVTQAVAAELCDICATLEPDTLLKSFCEELVELPLSKEDLRLVRSLHRYLGGSDS